MKFVVFNIVVGGALVWLVLDGSGMPDRPDPAPAPAGPTRVSTAAESRQSWDRGEHRVSSAEVGSRLSPSPLPEEGGSPAWAEALAPPPPGAGGGDPVPVAIPAGTPNVPAASDPVPDLSPDLPPDLPRKPLGEIVRELEDLYLRTAR